MECDCPECQRGSYRHLRDFVICYALGLAICAAFALSLAACLGAL